MLPLAVLLVTSGQAPAAITRYDISPAGSKVAVATSDNSVQVIDLEDGIPARVLGAHGDSVGALQFSPDGTRLATACLDGRARVFDIDTGAELASFEAFSGAGTCMHTGAYASWSKDGKRLLTVGRWKDAVLWNVPERTRIRDLGDDTGSVEIAFFGPDSSMIVTATDARTGRLWDGATGEPRSDPVRLPTIEVQNLALSPDGRRLAVGCADARARVVDVRTGKVEFTVSYKDVDLLNDLAVGSVEFSPDASHLLTTTFCEVRSSSAVTGVEEWRNCFGGGDGGCTFARYSPDGREVFVSQRSLWLDAKTGETRRQLRDSFHRLSSDGRYVTTLLDGELVVRDARSLATRCTVALTAEGRASVRK